MAKSCLVYVSKPIDFKETACPSKWDWAHCFWSTEFRYETLLIRLTFPVAFRTSRYAVCFLMKLRQDQIINTEVLSTLSLIQHELQH